MSTLKRSARRAAVLSVALVAALSLSACGSAETPAAEPTASAESTAAPKTPTEEPSSSAPEESSSPQAEEPSAEGGDMLAALQAVSPEVTGAEETEPGRWTVETSIVDPRGEDGSAEAQTAIAVCEAAVEQGASYVAVMEADGTHFVLYGHPAYGDVCTEV